MNPSEPARRYRPLEGACRWPSHVLGRGDGASAMDLKRALDVEEEVVDGDEEEQLAAGCPDAKRRRTFLK